MKKFLASTLTASLFAITATSTQAATLGPANFNVTTNLTSACQIVAAATPVLDFGTYTAFGSATTPAPTATIGLECTRNLATPVSFTFDGGTSYGVIAGLNYNVTASSVTTTPGTAATPALGGVGTPDLRTITLTGDMAAGQAGDCATATCAATVTRTLTITY
jgi:hypothetical protein